MANSAIRIPIPGSIINAPSSIDGDQLMFDSTAGGGGAYTNIKSLIQDLRPFTRQARLDFYVSMKDITESTVWEDAVTRGMVLSAKLDENDNPVNSDIRLGINLSEGDPTHTLEIVGDFMSWGRGNEGGSICGRVGYFTNYGLPAGSQGPTNDNVIFHTPIKKTYTEADLATIKTGLKTSGTVLVRDDLDATKKTYFAQAEYYLDDGYGISISGNSINVDDLPIIQSPTGVTVRLDMDANSNEDLFKVVDVRHTGITGDYSLLRLARRHDPEVTWDGTKFVVGNPTDQGGQGVRLSIGTGNRIVPSGFVMEDGITIDGSPHGSYYARLFGKVANPDDIVITGGSPYDPTTAFYYDTNTSQSSAVVQGTGQFGFLAGIDNMQSYGGYANPGSFVAGFLNKHNDGGGVKIKANDVNNDEFALFMENGEVDSPYNPAITGGSNGELNARHFTIAVDTTDTDVTSQYKNILAEHAPVFTVRATTGDTFIRGMVVLPFLPGINSQYTGTPSGSAQIGVMVYSTVKDAEGVVTIKRWTYSDLGGGLFGWVQSASYILPKGTLYAEADGTVKIAKGGDQIANHGLDGVESWITSD